MKIYLRRKNGEVNAVAEYDVSTNVCVVLKGSTVSSKIAYSEKFRGAKTVEKYRNDFVKGNTVKEDVVFKSPSTAANFVTGASTNGMTAWKNENGCSLKELSVKEG